MRVLSAEEGRVKVEFEVTRDLTNPFGTLHGGYTATLVDIGNVNKRIGALLLYIFTIENVQ